MCFIIYYKYYLHKIILNIRNIYINFTYKNKLYNTKLIALLLLYIKNESLFTLTS